MGNSADNIIIPKNWTFEDQSVADGFDRHVREQLPWYDMATNAVSHVCRHYIPEHGRVYDIGASTGNIGNAIAPILNEREVEFIPIESSPEMCGKYAGPRNFNLVNADARKYDFEPFDVAICFLVLMFLPVKDREPFLWNLRENLRPGGAIIVFDKTIPADGYAATVMWRLTLAGKVAANVDPKEIIAKELSLGGIQRPIDPAILEPGAIEWFRFGDFAGYLIEG